jgi:hypothetical protein
LGVVGGFAVAEAPQLSFLQVILYPNTPEAIPNCRKGCGVVYPSIISISAAKTYASILAEHAPYEPTDYYLLPSEPGYQFNSIAREQRTLCSVGFYKAYYDDISPCMPCPMGTYQNTPASSYCKPCSVGEYCPVGSVSPQPLRLVAQDYRTNFTFMSSRGSSVQQTMLLSLINPFGDGASNPYFFTLISIVFLLLGGSIILALLRAKPKAHRYLCFCSRPSLRHFLTG